MLFKLKSPVQYKTTQVLYLSGNCHFRYVASMQAYYRIFSLGLEVEAQGLRSNIISLEPLRCLKTQQQPEMVPN